MGGSDGSGWVMGEWLVGQWIVGVISFQKIYGLYGLKHHIVEKMLDVTLCDGRRQNVKIGLEFWKQNSQKAQGSSKKFETDLTTIEVIKEETEGFGRI